jgi:hypothetical protein
MVHLLMEMGKYKEEAQKAAIEYFKGCRLNQTVGSEEDDDPYGSLIQVIRKIYYVRKRTQRGYFVYTVSFKVIEIFNKFPQTLCTS